MNCLLNRFILRCQLIPIQLPGLTCEIYDIVKSAKFTAATEYAFATAFTAWVSSNFSLPMPTLINVAVAGYGVYYFLNRTTEDLYTFIKYYYREVGPGFFDHNGNFIGEYQIRKTMRVTKSSSGTGGSYGEEIRNSSVIEPWF